jgi:hypothetical protein
MADQDFRINIVTLADLTGIRLTQQQLEALQTAAKEGNKEAIAALKKLSDAQKEGAASAKVGFTGSAVGVGTIITTLTHAIILWKRFNDEQDRWVEGMIKAQEKARALGESILDMQEKAREAMRVSTEPLEQSFIRLQQEIIRLKSEQNLLNLPEQGEEWKKLAHDISIVESQLKGVTNQLQRQSEEAREKAKAELEKRVPGLKAEEPIKEAEAQTQRILMNEQAAAKAKAEGREKDAEMFTRSAEAYKASATPQQLADLQRIHELQDKLKPPAPPTYRPLSPEEFERQSEAAGPAGRKLSREEMAQAQLEARAARYQEVQKTRVEGEAARKDRDAEILAALREMIGLWR